MLAQGTDLLYRQALASSHRPYLRVEVWVADGSERLASDLIYETGSIRASLSSRVTRTFDFTVDESLFPFQVDDLLNPYSREVRAFRGIEFADGNRYVWPVFRGRIINVRLGPEATATVSCNDRAGDVVTATFEAPHNSQVGQLVSDEVRRLIVGGLPDATFGTFDSFFQTVPIESWEHDRAGALDEMATSVGAFWYALADGDFVLRKKPWTIPGDPVVTFSDATVDSDAPPTITGSSVERSREDVYNSVTVTGERADGTMPVFYTARDEDPANVTFIDGPFGVKNKLVSLRTPQLQGTAREAAQDQLRSSTALVETWDFATTVDAALELGDVIRLDARGQRNTIQVVASFALPMNLDGSGSMQVSCRAQVIGTLED